MSHGRRFGAFSGRCALLAAAALVLTFCGEAQLPDFQKNPAVAAFIDHMATKHRFSADALTGMFSAVGPNARVLALFRPSGPPPQVNPPRVPKPPKRVAETWKPYSLPKATASNWKLYSDLFLNEERVYGGACFWWDNAAALERAHQQYGVPPEIIAALIGVETRWGRRKGDFGVLEALATLAFHDPFRGEFFLGELEHFLLLSRENGADPLDAMGSYAGAIGIPQFMPSSWREYAIDFDGDGVIDLVGNFADSIGSVANYLYVHGWKRDEPVAHRATPAAKLDSAWAQATLPPALSVKDLKAGGVATGQENAPDLATFIELPTRPVSHWLGYWNYYAITRYNRSHEYAMTVLLLAEGIKAMGPIGPAPCPAVRGLAVHLYIADFGFLSERSDL
jgi:membrane-bound lytic murein transglycosylase B